MSLKGHMAILPAFDRADAFQEGLAIVTSNGLAGVIDTAGRYVIQPLYDRVFFESGFILTIRNGLYGLSDRDGNAILDNKFDRIEFIDNRAAMAYIEDRRYYVNLASGKVVFTDN
jgi:hypothetical protein